jgi:hypothetical protein
MDMADKAQEHIEKVISLLFCEDCGLVAAELVAEAFDQAGHSIVDREVSRVTPQDAYESPCVHKVDGVPGWIQSLGYKTY